MFFSNGKASPVGLVIILVARDFHEGTIVYLLEKLRQAGLSVSLVSPSSRLIKGYHGLIIKPDLSLEQLPAITTHKLIVIPDGQACTATLLADPRVHQLIADTLQQRGMVAAMTEAEVMLEQLGLVTANTAASFIWLKGQDLVAFSQQVIDSVDQASELAIRK